MGKVSRKEYLAAIRERYLKAGRSEKGRILAEFCAVCGYNRKYAVRLLNSPPRRERRRPGPRPRYGPEVRALLQRIWLAAEQPCSRRMVVVIRLWLPHYEMLYGTLAAEVKEKLSAMSHATIDRMLCPVRARFKRRGLSGTKPGTMLKNVIPVKSGGTPVTPGFLEADSVAHCGTSLEGNFAWSLTFTDVCSGWTENRAIWNKGAAGVLEQVKDVEGKLPFPILGFAVDNGSEFLNHHLWGYFTHRSNIVGFSRTRPYHKNDNARVEQKNWTHVRQLLGYDRFGCQGAVPLLNDLYATWSLYQNHFLPTFKLIEKVRVNAKYRKTYEPPQTPYDRLLNSSAVAEEAKRALADLHASLNPFELKKTVEKKLRRVFNLLRSPES